jgi:hypothetical protein
MQANQPVYRRGVVGRLFLTDCCGRHARFTVVETPQQGDPRSQPPGIGGMSVQSITYRELEMLRKFGIALFVITAVLISHASASTLFFNNQNTFTLGKR